MSKYGKEDVAKDTSSSTSQVSQAWHDARNDATSAGKLEERNKEKVSDSEHGGFLYNFFHGKKSN